MADWRGRGICPLCIFAAFVPILFAVLHYQNWGILSRENALDAFAVSNCVEVGPRHLGALPQSTANVFCTGCVTVIDEHGI
jgi:hypothetical protein